MGLVLMVMTLDLFGCLQEVMAKDVGEQALRVSDTPAKTAGLAVQEVSPPF